MSGHSKWATTKHKKAAIDAKRGKLFANLIKKIEVAARTGGGDPAGNPTLYDAIQKAKKNSVPNDNIDRAVKRGSGVGGEAVHYVEITYEAYGPGGVAILIDQSASVIAKSEIMKHAREGLPIPEGWGLGPDGQPTTDPEIALKGSMAPSGGYKGVGIALLVEIMAAAMTGATLGVDASPFSGTKGGPPKTGQFFIAIDPLASSGGDFVERIQALVGEMRDQPGVRTPGDGRSAERRRAEQRGVAINGATLERIRALL